MADVLARLEKRGLVIRRRSRSDQRMKLVSATASARRLLLRIDPHARRAHERTVAALPVGQQAALVEALAKLVDAAPGVAGPPPAEPRSGRREAVRTIEPGRPARR